MAAGAAQRAHRAPGKPQRLRWRSQLVVVGAVGAVVGVIALTDGDDGGYDYDAVCVDATGTRVPDGQCPPPGGGSGGGAGFVGPRWYYIPSGSQAPAVGVRATGGSTTLPDLGRYAVHEGGIDARGGTVSRGGFGGRSGGGGRGGGSVGG